MFLDLHSVDPRHFHDQSFDICICGAGVAGIALALRLPRRFRIALLEAGGIKFSRKSQDLYRGVNTGHEYFPLDFTRVRFFGGSSNHWGGWCSPLQSRDFQRNACIERLGWPIKRSDLDPYLVDAAAILDVKFDGGGQKAGWADTVDDFQEAEFAFSRPPTRMGMKYQQQIERSSNILCYLHANLTDIGLVENHSSVKDVEIRDYAGAIHRLKTRSLVLATGGIENPRILLYCNKQVSTGIGNNNGLVGKYFGEHPKARVGTLLLEDDVKNSHLLGQRSIITPTTSLLCREQILSSKIIVNTIEPQGSDRSFRDQMNSIICGSDNATKLVSTIQDKPLFCADGHVILSAEQLPNPLSRITLSDEMDRFGKPKVALHWDLTELDNRSILLTTLRFAEAFAESGLGRVRVADWLLEENIEFPSYYNGEVGGNHHMCTTRMANTPDDGVVDANGKVFDIDNLYVAGSSVFPTTGYANPTLTIVQLTLRLADHLKRVL